MTQVKIRFPDAMETSLITLCGIAVDARTEPTILGDRTATEAFEAAPRGSKPASRMTQLVPPVPDMSRYVRYEIVGT